MHTECAMLPFFCLGNACVNTWLLKAPHWPTGLCMHTDNGLTMLFDRVMHACTNTSHTVLLCLFGEGCYHTLHVLFLAYCLS